MLAYIIRNGQTFKHTLFFKNFLVKPISRFDIIPSESVISFHIRRFVRPYWGFSFSGLTVRGWRSNMGAQIPVLFPRIFFTILYCVNDRENFRSTRDGLLSVIKSLQFLSWLYNTLWNLPIWSTVSFKYRLCHYSLRLLKTIDFTFHSRACDIRLEYFPRLVVHCVCVLASLPEKPVFDNTNSHQVSSGVLDDSIYLIILQFFVLMSPHPLKFLRHFPFDFIFGLVFR